MGQGINKVLSVRERHSQKVSPYETQSWASWIDYLVFPESCLVMPHYPAKIQYSIIGLRFGIFTGVCLPQPLTF